MGIGMRSILDTRIEGYDKMFLDTNVMLQLICREGTRWKEMEKAVLRHMEKIAIPETAYTEMDRLLNPARRPEWDMSKLRGRFARYFPAHMRLDTPEEDLAGRINDSWEYLWNVARNFTGPEAQDWRGGKNFSLGLRWHRTSPAEAMQVLLDNAVPDMRIWACVATYADRHPSERVLLVSCDHDVHMLRRICPENMTIVRCYSNWD